MYSLIDIITDITDIIRRRVSSLLAVNGSAVASGDHPAPTSSTSFTVDPQGSQQQVRSLAYFFGLPLRAMLHFDSCICVF